MIDFEPSHRNPLHNVPRDFLFAPVVKPRGTRVRVTGQALHVLQRHTLFKQIRNRRDPEGVRGEARGQASVFEAALHHPADVIHMDTRFRERLGFAQRRAEQGSARGRILKPGNVEITGECPLQIVTLRDLTGSVATFKRRQVIACAPMHAQLPNRKGCR
jgi:hypothetical protein